MHQLHEEVDRLLEVDDVQKMAAQLAKGLRDEVKKKLKAAGIKASVKLIRQSYRAGFNVRLPMPYEQWPDLKKIMVGVRPKDTVAVKYHLFLYDKIGDATLFVQPVRV